MSSPTLGKSVAGAAIAIDIDRLIASRMLLTANSGGGKSWALRRVLEQTHGRIQQLVIDPEGEFYTLREKHDLVLAAKGGDCPAEPRSAALLARRLLELGTSAILDLYELQPHDRVIFVRRFLESLMSAPRELWHPVLVAIDEAHKFAPESGHGEAESLEAVASLMSQGRKRGFCGLLATQRLAKLSKDVAAEANNLWIGRMSLDVDVKRAAGPLGLTPRDATARLKALEPGHGFAFGPALSRDVVELLVGEVHTTHPRAGQTAPPPAPPRERVRRLLAQLANLPKEAEEEARTIGEAKARITALERELAASKKAQPEPKVERVEVLIAPPKMVEELAAAHRGYKESFDKLYGLSAELLAHVQQATATQEPMVMKPRTLTTNLRLPPTLDAHARNGRAPLAAHRTPSTSSGDASLGFGERACLIAIAQTPGGCTREQVSILAGYKRSTRDAYLQRLGARGLIEFTNAGAGVIGATAAGLDALGADFEPLPTGDALRDYWFAKLPDGERKVLEVVCGAHPESIDREELTDRTGYKRSTRDAYLQRLRTRRLVVDEGRGLVRAAGELFDMAVR